MRLHALRVEKVMFENNAQDKIEGEETTLSYYPNAQAAWGTEINQVQNPLGNIIDKPKDMIQPLWHTFERNMDP